MFAICFAAITSIPSSKLCRSLFNQGRNALLRQYRLDFEQALAKANFMSHPNVTTVQALTLFLTCARMSEEKTYVWSMVGLLIRLAMKLGLHRDPADLGLIPFLCEMRRRLWWQIYALDIRTAEESDMNPFICEHSFNTKFPANVNDADLDADMTHHVSGAQGRTEMLFSLVRFHVSFAARMIVFAPDLTADSTQASLSWAERNNMLDELVAKIQDKYLQFCDPQIPICFLTERATRMILTKVKLTMNHPARNNSRACLEIMRDLALRSIEILEGAHMLRTHDKLSGWVWLFEKYVDWDAVAFLLHLTIAAPSAVPLERASAAIGVFFSDWGGRVADMQRWQRLVNLRVKAMAKQSMLASLSTATAAGTGTAAADVLAQVASSTPFEQIGTTGCCLSEAMQSDPAPALDFAYPLNFTSADTTNIGVADMAAGADWNLDNFSFTQGGPSWDMDFDDKVFRFEGPQ
ncbi:hypothetical protein K458DRAFT_414016 [Lentithecium fluviatile CBS 122367]|uniref:Xylanolytic transcriptional activator regulatory domain-containing protein n=1 Tax=Lentithecium fluviatile CBS 122367 TaxID=1168545 RepID=A0A6G1JHZ3_9PLEO|nr:hypothetical protein K458DRAFT_414016 [Lentithecium fluviatile CBS 122367]